MHRNDGAILRESVPSPRDQSPQTFRVGGSPNAREAGQWIQALTGLQKSPSPVRAYLHRVGLQYRKVAPIPSKANPEVQETFLTDPREPILAEAQAGLRHVFFVGALLAICGV